MQKGHCPPDRVLRRARVWEATSMGNTDRTEVIRDADAIPWQEGFLIQITALLLSGCETLGKLLNLREPQPRRL